MKYFIDSCIWINLIRKEGDITKGEPYWKITERFLEFILEYNHEIYVSTEVMKELHRELKEDFKTANELILNMESINIKLQPYYKKVREMEELTDYEIGFSDCSHIIVCKEIGAILVTRDNKLIKYAKKYVEVKKPENLTI